MITFLSLVVGLSITGFTLMFSSSAHLRLLSVLIVCGAAVIVGGVLTAQLNGGRPYGYDVPIGFDQWRTSEPTDRDEPVTPKPLPHQDDGPPIA